MSEIIDLELNSVFIEIEKLVEDQCGNGQALYLLELEKMLACIEGPEQAARYIRDLLAAGKTWQYIRYSMGIRRDKRLDALCADAGQSIDEYAKEHYCRLFLRNAEEALSKALRNVSVSCETASNAITELAKAAANNLPIPDKKERMKQIMRVRRHRSRKGMKRRK